VQLPVASHFYFRRCSRCSPPCVRGETDLLPRKNSHCALHAQMIVFRLGDGAPSWRCSKKSGSLGFRGPEYFLGSGIGYAKLWLATASCLRAVFTFPGTPALTALKLGEAEKTSCAQWRARRAATGGLCGRLLVVCFSFRTSDRKESHSCHRGHPKKNA
jgi:hypothetical protein